MYDCTRNGFAWNSKTHRIQIIPGILLRLHNNLLLLIILFVWGGGRGISGGRRFGPFVSKTKRRRWLPSNRCSRPGDSFLIYNMIRYCWTGKLIVFRCDIFIFSHRYNIIVVCHFCSLSVRILCLVIAL